MKINAVNEEEFEKCLKEKREKKYWYLSDLIAESEIDYITDIRRNNEDLMIFARLHYETTSENNPGSVETYDRLENECNIKNIDITDMLKAVILEQEVIGEQLNRSMK